MTNVQTRTAKYKQNEQNLNSFYEYKKLIFTKNKKDLMRVVSYKIYRHYPINGFILKTIII